MVTKDFPVEIQKDTNDCGPASLKIICRFYGRHVAINHLREICNVSHNGVSFLDLQNAAISLGYDTVTIKCSYDVLLKNVPLPAIIFCHNNHFSVLYDINDDYVKVSDPDKGLLVIPRNIFTKNWYLGKSEVGAVLALSPNQNVNTNNLNIGMNKKFVYNKVKDSHDVILLLTNKSDLSIIHKIKSIIKSKGSNLDFYILYNQSQNNKLPKLLQPYSCIIHTFTSDIYTRKDCIILQKEAYYD